MSSGIVLRPYQTRTIDGLRTGFRTPRADGKGKKKRGLVVSPTGSGKTTIAARAVQAHLESHPSPKVVWLAHRRELLVQGVDRLRQFGCRVEYEGESVGAPVYATSVQTVLASGEAPDATLLVLDEAHHYAAAEWFTVPKAYMAQEEPPHVIGLSATPEREDGSGLHTLFEFVVVAAQVRELMDLNVEDPSTGLVEPLILHPEPGSLGKGQIARHPLRAYQEDGNGESCVVFSPSVKAAETWAADFRDAGISAECIHGGLAPEVRADLLARYEAGDIRVLTNQQILTEGWDSPRTKCLVLARNIASTALYQQVLGRALRPWWCPMRGQWTRPTILDVADTCSRHGPPDAELEFFLEGRAVRRAGVNPDARFCRTCGVIVDGSSCDKCGATGKELDMPRDANVALRQFQRSQWAQALTRHQRVQILAKWFMECDAKGHQRRAAGYKYKGVFKHYPDRNIIKAAERAITQMRGAR